MIRRLFLALAALLALATPALATGPTVGPACRVVFTPSASTDVAAYDVFVGTAPGSYGPAQRVPLADFTAATAPDPVTGDPVNLTGMTVRFTAKRLIGEAMAQAVFRKDNGALGGVSVTNAAAGEFEVLPDAAETSGLEDGVVPLLCDVELEGAGRTETGNFGSADAPQFVAPLLVVADVTRLV